MMRKQIFEQDVSAGSARPPTSPTHQRPRTSPAGRGEEPTRASQPAGRVENARRTCPLAEHHRVIIESPWFFLMISAATPMETINDKLQRQIKALTNSFLACRLIGSELHRARITVDRATVQVSRV